MSLIRTIAALASAACIIMSAYFFGHGISEGHAMPYVISGIALAVGLILVVAQVKLGSGEAAH